MVWEDPPGAVTNVTRREDAKLSPTTREAEEEEEEEGEEEEEEEEEEEFFIYIFE